MLPGALLVGDGAGLLDAVRLKGVHRAIQSGIAAGDTVAEALALDRLPDVFHAGITHDEHQPCHLKIKERERCVRECLAVYGAPCTRFCPAHVYTLADDGTAIKIDAANCLHCKTCQVKDPLQNIEWCLPEGGSGPNYPGL